MRAYNSSQEALNHNFNKYQGQLEAEYRKTPNGIIDNAQSIIFNPILPKRKYDLARDSILSASDLKSRIEEAVMHDDPMEIHQLRLTRKQVMDFVYTVKGAKSLASSLSCQRVSS